MTRPQGFTLVEMVVTVALVGLLASIAVPLAELAVQRDKERELRRSLRELRAAIDEYKRAVDEGRVERKADQSGYPPELKVLAEGVRDQRSPTGAKIYFLRRIPRDPLASRDETEPPERSWGLRSYESAPEAPKEGKDVYDVYSRNEGTGLNGVPYKEW